MKKKLCLIIAGTLAAICAAVCLFLYKTQWKKTEIYAETCPEDTAYSLVIYTVGEADFPYGATHLQARVLNNGRAVNRYGFDMNNDGKAMDGENFYVTWHAGSVSLNVSAEESDTVFLTLGFDGTVDVAYID